MAQAVRNVPRLSFRPRQVVERLLRELPRRIRDVLVRRYGLGRGRSPQTLEEIGCHYGITRERVRQLERYGIQLIQQSDAYRQEAAVFEELAASVAAAGGVVHEEEILSHLASNRDNEHYLRFLFVVGEAFIYHKETPHFRARWSIDPVLAQRVETALRALYDELSDEDLLSEHEMIQRFLRYLQTLDQQAFTEEVVSRWLFFSKQLGRNPLGDWGRARAPHVRLRGIRDYAYLALKRHGSPLHYRQVAKEITRLFRRKAHEGTTHNELIRDPRFVLVGRGVYALREWGYREGDLKDVIAGVLAQSGPLTQEELVARVQQERYVKKSTIMSNVRDTSRFQRLPDGRYALRQHTEPVSGIVEGGQNVPVNRSFTTPQSP